MARLALEHLIKKILREREKLKCQGHKVCWSEDIKHSNHRSALWCFQPNEQAEVIIAAAFDYSFAVQSVNVWGAVYHRLIVCACALIGSLWCLLAHRNKITDRLAAACILSQAIHWGSTPRAPPNESKRNCSETRSLNLFNCLNVTARHCCRLLSLGCGALGLNQNTAGNEVLFFHTPLLICQAINLEHETAFETYFLYNLAVKLSIQ